MKEEARVSGCGRENDLIAFLYGELDPGERTVFRSHTQECRSCNAELREFTNIRESVGAWRDEALGGFTSPAVEASAVVRADRPGPTALTALREFFNLSPLWMKGAVVFASLLFCLFAVLAAARFRDAPPPPVAASPTGKTYSEQELNALVERRVQDEVQRITNSSAPPSKSTVMVKRTAEQGSGRRAANRGSEIAANVPQQNARRPLSKVERQQLAADLRLIDNTADGELDLLDDRINQ
ncbi:MAG: anti-sigma factor family protein [Pyrinomonadaceae bacterium]